MRIYLSSYRFGGRRDALRKPRGRALIVMNALDEYPDRLLTWDREADDLARLGYDSEELDLRDHWMPSRDALQARLTTADLLWVVGGNAFVLAKAATAAGLSTALADSPHLTYAGYSAGACLTSVDLRGIELMDDASTLPSGYGQEMAVATLNLTGTRVVPHAGTAEAGRATAALRSDGLDFVEIADGDDWLIA